MCVYNMSYHNCMCHPSYATVIVTKGKRKGNKLIMLTDTVHCVCQKLQWKGVCMGREVTKNYHVSGITEYFLTQGEFWEFNFWNCVETRQLSQGWTTLAIEPSDGKRLFEIFTANTYVCEWKKAVDCMHVNINLLHVYTHTHWCMSSM